MFYLTPLPLFLSAALSIQGWLELIPDNHKTNKHFDSQSQPDIHGLFQLWHALYKYEQCLGMRQPPSRVIWILHQGLSELYKSDWWTLLDTWHFWSALWVLLMYLSSLATHHILFQRLIKNVNFLVKSSTCMKCVQDGTKCCIILWASNYLLQKINQNI